MLKRRKRGRPRTGHDPMVGVRLPAAILSKVDKMAAEIGADRSTIIRLMVEYVLEYGSPELRTFRSVLVMGLRGWKGRGGAADKIAGAVMGNIKDQATAYLAARKAAPARRARLSSHQHMPTLGSRTGQARDGTDAIS